MTYKTESISLAKNDEFHNDVDALNSGAVLTECEYDEKIDELCIRYGVDSVAFFQALMIRPSVLKVRAWHKAVVDFEIAQRGSR